MLILCVIMAQQAISNDGSDYKIEDTIGNVSEFCYILTLLITIIID